MTTYTPPPEPGRTASRRNRPVPLVIGILLALMGLPLLLGGLGLGWAMATQRDDDGFFSTPTEQLSTQTVALSSEVVNLGKAGPNDWWADHHLATVRLSARSEGARAVFIGIAPSADVARYLGSASYDEISELRTDPFDYSLTRRGIGGDLSAAPTDQGFWTAQSSGPGTQALTWDLQPGTYTAVVMNLDGSPGVDVDLSAGGRLGWLTPLAWSLGLLGGTLILGAALLVVYGARPPGPRVPRRTGPGQPPGAVGPDTPVTLVGAQDPQPVWRGKDDVADELLADAPPIYIQEKIDPRVLVENLRRTARAGEPEPEATLFDTFDGLDELDLVDSSPPGARSGSARRWPGSRSPCAWTPPPCMSSATASCSRLTR